MFWPGRGLIQQPSECEASALPPEQFSHVNIDYLFLNCIFDGAQLKKKSWLHRTSIRQPSEHEANALTSTQFSHINVDNLFLNCIFNEYMIKYTVFNNIFLMYKSHMYGVNAYFVVCVEFDCIFCVFLDVSFFIYWIISTTSRLCDKIPCKIGEVSKPFSHLWVYKLEYILVWMFMHSFRCAPLVT